MARNLRSVFSRVAPATSRLSYSRAQKRLLGFLALALIVLLIVFFTLTSSFEIPNIRDRFRISKHSPFPSPDRYHMPGTGEKIIIKNGSSIQHLDPIPYDDRYPTTKALVLASFSKQNMDWLEDMRSDWKIYRYVLDDPNPHAGLSVPRNQGREAMAYLTFIIDNYHNLPNFTVFHHGHLRAWHQVEPTPMKIRALNLSALAHDHYINFRCSLSPGCTSDTIIDVKNPVRGDVRKHAALIPNFWKTMFGPDSPYDFGPPPDKLSVPCCAQFAVTREAIRAHSLKFWQTYRRPLERDLSEYKNEWGEFATSYFLGICYEKLWHMVFGQPSVYCPDENYCRKIQFSDAVVCDRYTGAFQATTQNWESIRCINKWQDD